MNHGCASPGMGELGFSLLPPQWLRSAAANALKSLKVNVNVPTPAGPVSVDPTDPRVLQAVRDTIKNTTISVRGGNAPQPASPVQQADDLVNTHVPGGWLTVAAVGVGVAFLLSRRGKKRS